MITTNSILTVYNLKKTFISNGWFQKKTEFTAVNDISFDLNEGEILGILGPNGAGKTTTIQMLLGLLTPTSGSIYYFGQDFYKYRSLIMEKICFASSYLKLPGSLTVEENLNVYGKIYNIPNNIRYKAIDEKIKLFGLEKSRKKLTKHLSAGQLTRLMLAKAFLPNPKIVLLDEPTAALDPEITIEVRKFILEQRKNFNTSIIFTSHNLAEVEELCDRVLIIKDGKIIESDTPSKLASTVKTSHIQLYIPENIDKLISFVKDKKLPYRTEKSFIEIDINEDEIATLLVDIFHLGLKYTQISISKPTLEDYFLKILK